MFRGNNILKFISFILPIILLSWGCSEKTDEAANRRIAILEDSRNLGGEELAAFFQHPQAQIRSRAAAAAGRIGDADIVPDLLDLLNDQEEDVRLEAVFALGQLKDSSAVEPLIDSFHRSSPGEQDEILNALGRIGGVKSIEFLRGRLSSGEFELLPAVVYSLTRARGVTSLPAIAEYLSDTSAAVRRAAAYFCCRKADSTVKAVLLKKLNDDDALVRKYSAGALGRIGAPDIAHHLAPMFSDPDRSVRINAVRAAGKCASEIVVFELLNLAESDEYAIFRPALEALGNLKSPSAAAPLEKLTRQDSGDKLPYLLICLAKIEGERFFPFSDTYSDHPDPVVRRAVGYSLKFIKSPKALALAQDMLTDSDETVRTAATAGLAAQGAAAEPILRDLLTDGDWAVRTAAAEGLTEIGMAGSFDALAECLQAHKNAALPEEVRSLLKALFKLDREKALPFIRDAVTSNQPAVAALAKELLVESGEEIPILSPPDDRGYPADFGEHLGNIRISILTEKGRIEIELFGDEAPVVSTNFLRLIRNHYFTGLTFHRVVADFVVQGGDPRGDGWGGPGYTIRDQINRRKFVRGTVGLANAGLDTGGSQFFICLSPQPHLDGSYTAFGQVIKGFGVLDRLVEGDSIEDIIVTPQPKPRIRKL